MYRSLTNDERAVMVAVVACADCGDTMYARSVFIRADGANDRLFCRECAGVPVDGPTEVTTMDATMVRVTWTLIPGTPDYSAPGGWVARYVRTVRGFGCFRTFRPDGTEYGIGGRPDWVPA
jgi:hypothetical protein